jgi:hypothetical protein
MQGEDHRNTASDTVSEVVKPMAVTNNAEKCLVDHLKILRLANFFSIQALPRVST